MSSQQASTFDQPSPRTPRGATSADVRFRYRSEPTRLREVAQQLAAWQSISDHKDWREVTANSSAEAVVCPDKALAAFAQLAALRLNSRNTHISLVGEEHEYVLAEVNRTTPFQQLYNKHVHESLSLGTCKLEREQGLNWDASSEWRKARAHRKVATDPEHYQLEGLSQHAFIVSDVRNNPKYQHRPVMEIIPWIRFFCSIPLRSIRGSIVGHLAVFDDKPRYGLSCSELSFLEDVADTIVEHLDSMLVRSQMQLSDRYLQGITLFNTGKSSLREWWSIQDDNRRSGRGRHVRKDDNADRQDRVNDEFGLASDAQSASSCRSPAEGYFDSTGGSRNEQEIASDEPVEHIHASSAVPTKTNALSRSEINIDAAYADIYARASNLLREALSATGVVFLDAKHDRQTTPNWQAPHDSYSSDTSTEEGDMCELNGSSLRTTTTQQQAEFRNGLNFRFSKSALRRLMRRHPRGGVVHFDKDGIAQLSSDEDSRTSGEDDAVPKADPKRTTIQALTKTIPEACSLAFFPLMDQNTRAWRSCIFAWSNDERRVFDQHHDLLYLATFGQSVVVELSHIDSIALSHAKDTFISSISHELRSPLHGILAGVEFIQDSELTAFQAEMAHSIHTAGRILLDTVDHVLDYSKISTHAREVRSQTDKRRLSSNAPASNQDSITEAVDLAQLTEDIVETSLAADRSRSSNTSGVTSPVGGTDEESSDLSKGVAVSLYIEPQNDWMVKIPPGAWIRILMNLVGNSLKFTKHGCINIRLKATPSQPGKIALELCVEDTGSGMSKNFLTGGLFVPFKQEDPLAVGTGLGVSIVKRLVDALGGRMHVESQQGRGTKVTIRFEANSATPSSSEDSPKAAVDHFQIIATPQTSNASMAITQSVLQMAKTWLQCEAVALASPVAHNKSGKAVCAISDECLRNMYCEEPDNGRAKLDNLAKHYSHILVLATSKNTLSISDDIGQLPIQHIFLHQPIGPRKLIRAIVSDRDSTLAQQPQHDARRQDVGPLRRSFSAEPRRLEPDAGLDGVTESMAAYNIRTSHGPKSPAGTEDTAPDSDALSSIDSRIEHSRRGMAVMLVEDNDINMKFLVALMQKLKTSFHCASNGQEAVDLYSSPQNNYALILMDMSMPVMDGFTATTEIRRLEAKRGMPRVNITALTGVTSQDSKKRAFSCGVDEFYSKPVKMKEIQMLLNRIRAKEIEE